MVIQKNRQKNEKIKVSASANIVKGFREQKVTTNTDDSVEEEISGEEEEEKP
jgi:hypothetical protein